MPNRHAFISHLLATLLLSLSPLAPAATTQVDLTHYDPSSEIHVTQSPTHLTATWPIDAAHTGLLQLSLDPTQPLISQLATQSTNSAPLTILQNVSPCIILTVGTRDLKPNGWTIFFDNPPKRPYQSHPLTLTRTTATVTTTPGGRTTITLSPAIAGPFTGDFRFTLYPHSPLLRAAAVLSTTRDATALLYDTGLTAAPPLAPGQSAGSDSDQSAAPDSSSIPQPAIRNPQSPALPWKSITYTNLSNDLVHSPATEEAHPVQVRHRLILAEGHQGGTLALVPAPHQFFYPLDFVDNLSSCWLGTRYRNLIPSPAFGVRQTLEGDHRWVPWMNSPPNSLQDLGVFYLLSPGDASQATTDALAFTHNDTFLPLEGYKTFSSHYHIEHTVDFLTQQKSQHTTGIPAGLETPPFVTRFKQMGVNAVHLAEFHLADRDMQIADRLTRLQTLHSECARLSDDSFLLIPGEEPNVHLGGHWLSLFPKPVYWTLHRKPGEPFSEQDPTHGTVYHVGNAADVLHLMEQEHGLMWTAHPRIKGSTGFPDLYKDQPFFKSDHFLGGAWKALPADCSLPRLGTRVLDLLDDMNNWGDHKQSLGEVDVFKINADSELYAHMNVNYLQLDSLPTFKDGWQPILTALRAGHFFTTTGEVLIPTFTIDDAHSGDTLPTPTTPTSHLRATLSWTFPLTFADLVTGDGTHTTHHRIDLSDTHPFGTRTLDLSLDLRGCKWARLEVWDIATNGAYTQPIWIK